MQRTKALRKVEKMEIARKLLAKNGPLDEIGELTELSDKKSHALEKDKWPSFKKMACCLEIFEAFSQKFHRKITSFSFFLICFVL